MKIRVILAAVIFFTIFSAPVFAQEKRGVAADLKSLIDSGTVSVITVMTSAGFLSSPWGVVLRDIKVFSVSADFILVLEAGNMKFGIDLLKAGGYGYDSKAKSLVVWMF